MPTVLRSNGFAVRIYPDDHLPPHVHVFRGGDSVKINLGTAEVRPWIERIVGMSDRDAVAALQLVIAHRAQLRRAWRRIHGN